MDWEGVGFTLGVWQQLARRYWKKVFTIFGYNKE